MSFINIFSMHKVVLGIVITLFVSILLNFDMNVEANTKNVHKSLMLQLTSSNLRRYHH